MKILSFQINEEYIRGPEFLVKDIQVNGARHLILAMQQQLQHLRVT